MSCPVASGFGYHECLRDVDLGIWYEYEAVAQEAQPLHHSLFSFLGLPIVHAVVFRTIYTRPAAVGARSGTCRVGSVRSC